MTPLTTADFGPFFEEVWGFRPFEWQQRLLDQVVADGRWPDLIDIPTGLGKTATIDIALFALAIEASANSDHSRWRFPHRIVMVVDRRVVVDQAHDRAILLAQHITDGSAGPITAQVAAALRSRSAEPTDDTPNPPLLTSVLRGGIVRDETWAQRPDVPAVLASTVDQVGSRLLFRGYGLSPGNRPIHAGLLGNDTLLLLDEVHLAPSFADTLDAVSVLGDRTVAGVPRRFGVVHLTATAAAGRERTRFPTEPIPRRAVTPTEAAEAPPADAVVLRRTCNRKPADLLEVKVPADPAKANDAFAKAIEKEVVARQNGTTRFAVIVNRVDTARRVARRLLAIAAKSGEFDVHLLTGRMRAADRDTVVGGDDGLAVRLQPGPRSPDERPVIVVATQSLEAGADFDVDVLVTECASLDALRQRFGRVDRDGQRWSAGATNRSLIVCRSTDVAPKVPDPVYGPALPATWRWLQDQEDVDFAHLAMDLPAGDDLAALLPDPSFAPILAASQLDRWNRTSEREMSAEPEVAQWLHGVTATDEIADVQLVWRSGMDRSLFRWDESSDPGDAYNDDQLADWVTEQLTLVPPMAAEALAVPVGEARRWLSEGTGDPTLADAPMATESQFVRNQEAPTRLVARWIDGAAELIPPARVRPGDTIVLPGDVGGITLRNWDPSGTTPVEGLAPALLPKIRGQVTVLLSEATCSDGTGIRPAPQDLEGLRASERRAILDDYLTNNESLWRGHEAARPRRERAVTTGIDDDGPIRSYLVIASAVAATTALNPGRGTSLATDRSDDSLSLIGEPMNLSNHLLGVGYHADRFARALGWSEDITRALRLAGEVHDAGKADPRFQAILAGGSTYTQLLAKSAAQVSDPVATRAARRAAGYPRGARHELLSLALITDLDAGDLDKDLVAHLVASHHGWGRYRFRPVVDRRPTEVELAVESTVLDRTIELSSITDHGLQELGAGHSDRFARLTATYGWWGLAQIEAVLRLADHHRSRLEQSGAVEVGAAAQEVAS